jgi:hypothetical protein
VGAHTTVAIIIVSIKLNQNKRNLRLGVFTEYFIHIRAWQYWSFVDLTAITEAYDRPYGSWHEACVEAKLAAEAHPAANSACEEWA